MDFQYKHESPKTLDVSLQTDGSFLCFASTDSQKNNTIISPAVEVHTFYFFFAARSNSFFHLFSVSASETTLARYLIPIAVITATAAFRNFIELRLYKKTK